ncbi:MAG: TIGR00374 family protein [Bacteroidetes bacterium 4572_112]|nr:MAG: TIGR00374 family protein [Bacteroidetes bacterium 4572_112]
MSAAPKQIIQAFSGWKIILAVLFGISVSIYLITDDFSINNYEKIHLGYISVLFLLLAIVLEAIRDIAYMYRIRIMTDKKISWKHSFEVIMLWEFASALTPSVVGGSAVALFIVNKEIKNAGKATAIVMITALLDELFYIIMVPLVFLFVGSQELFISTEFKLFNLGDFPTQTIFYAGYGFILLLTSVIVFAIFFKPRLFKSILHAIFSISFLKRWRNNVDQTGDDIITTSTEMRGKDLSFWAKVFGATMISWITRFAVINALILVLIGHGDQILIFGRQLIMWVILLISPTPGGSGVAEFMLPKFLGEFMNPYSHEIALAWRLLSYYSYLIIGSIVLPIWLRRVYKRSK